VLLVVMTLFAVACSSPTVGGGCSQSSDCTQSFMQSDTSFPPVCIGPGTDGGGKVNGGYCTAQCLQRGSTTGCPANTVCDIWPMGAATLYCLAICKQQTDCRSGFNCNGITASPYKACQ
jgi:hypothetical protein